MIKWLTTVYAAFDEVLQRDFKTDIVKIETQHDHFLAVSGIFEPDGMAADLCVDAACRMAQAIADVKQPPQPVDHLRSRVDALTQVIEPERLLLSSSCGCGRVPHDEAIRLMRNLVKAAGGE